MLLQPKQCVCTDGKGVGQLCRVCVPSCNPACGACSCPDGRGVSAHVQLLEMKQSTGPKIPSHSLFLVLSFYLVSPVLKRQVSFLRNPSEITNHAKAGDAGAIPPCSGALPAATVSLSPQAECSWPQGLRAAGFSIFPFSPP